MELSRSGVDGLELKHMSCSLLDMSFRLRQESSQRKKSDCADHCAAGAIGGRTARQVPRELSSEGDGRQRCNVEVVILV
jgi:hypothetical protein